MQESADIRRPRLLVLASTYPRWSDDPEPGFVHELSKRLTDKFDVTVLGPHAPGAATKEMLDGVRVVRYHYAPAQLETLVNDGGIVTNLNRHRWKWLLVPGFVLMQAWCAWRIIRRWRPDVIHAHWLIPQGLVIALLGLVDRRVPPFVVTSHGADLFALQARPLQVLKRFVLRRATHITVVSRVMRDVILQMGVKPDKVTVEPMGVDLQTRFVPSQSNVRSANEILFVGRLVEKKGLRLLIDAMPAIRKRHPDVRLAVAGFGPEEPACRKRVHELDLGDCVRFLGAVPQSELPRLYQVAGVFVAPFIRTADGDQEGLGLVMVEAAGCGCPVVAGNVPAVRDVICDEAIGTLVACGDTAALADSVCRALAMPATAANVLARRRGVSRFDWQHRADAYASILAVAAQN
jgi:glycosyltransferase involved in cell wall biosynthesis